MIKKLVPLLTLSLISNFVLFFFLIDQGITIAHMESSVSYEARKSESLFLDVSNIYLCSDITKLHSLKLDKSGNSDLNGATLYIESNIVTAIGFRNDLSPKVECNN